MSNVKIVAADQLPGGAWSIVSDMLEDEELMQAIDIIGWEIKLSLKSEYCKKDLFLVFGCANIHLEILYKY